MNTRDTLYTQDNDLIISGVKATELARTFGTPLYVMDAAYITEVCRAFKDVMSACGNLAVVYVSKAFATLATTKLIAAEGLWFEAVSGGELNMLKQAEVNFDTVLFNGNNKTFKEISDGVDFGVKYFIIDNLNEIDLIDACASQKGVSQEVLIRINPCVSAHTHEAVQTSAPNSKFGFGLDGEAKAVILKIKSKSNLVFKGLQLHIGSQVYESSSYNLAVDTATRFMAELSAEGISVDVLDLGGGFGIYYTDDDPKFTPRRYAYTVKSIAERVKEACKALNLNLPFIIFEPGRCVVGEAGVTLYTVGGIKTFKNHERKYVVIDGGMFENPRNALYEAKYSALIVNKANAKQTDIVTLAGKCCESGDVIAKDIPLQPAAVGDIVAVFSTGAYNYSMASNYNLNAVPPVVLVKDGLADYIVKPQTYDDLLRNNVVPSWL